MEKIWDREKVLIFRSPFLGGFTVCKKDDTRNRGFRNIFDGNYNKKGLIIVKIGISYTSRTNTSVRKTGFDCIIFK